MKLFISWSGKESQAVAEVLRDLLPGIVNAVEPWLSSDDIEPGARWSSDMARKLEETNFGIICLTPDNIRSPWIHFEAGALSKRLEVSRIIPYLVRLEPGTLNGPLSQFQNVKADRGGTRRLLVVMNQAVIDEGQRGLEERLLEASYDVWWPQLRKRLDGLQQAQETLRIQEKAQGERSERETLEEVLMLLRNIERWQRGHAISEVLHVDDVNELLKLYYERAGITAQRKAIEPPPKPLSITSDELYSDSRKVAALISEYRDYSIHGNLREVLRRISPWG